MNLKQAPLFVADFTDVCDKIKSQRSKTQRTRNAEHLCLHLTHESVFPCYKPLPNKVKHNSTLL